MTLNEFISFYYDIEKSISNNRLYDVMRRIKLLCEKMTETDLSSRILNVENTYKYMLEYFVKGANDPMRDDMLRKIKCELYSINDDLLKRLVLVKQQYPLLSNSANMQTSNEINLDVDNISNADIAALFYLIAYDENPITDARVKILNEIIFNKNDVYVDKGLVISSIFLLLLHQYSDSAFSLLIHVYINSNVDIKLRIKALLYIYFLSFRYEKRILLSEEISNELSLVKAKPDFSKHVSSLILQHLRSRNSDLLNDKVEKEILPEIMKLSPKIKGFKNKKSITIDEIIDANPEWDKMMQNSDLTSALKDISEIQFDGADIFINTFKQLRHHVFFNIVHNWFAEFNSSSMMINSNLSDEINNVLADAAMISDTDKFALSLSINGLSDDMKNMMIQSFKEQTDIMQQYNSKAKLNTTTQYELIVRNIMQDLYRFFKFVGMGKCVKNPFEYVPLSDYNAIISENDLSAADIMICADYLMKYKNYREAIVYLEMLINKGEVNHTTLQKIGFCHQCMNNYSLAIEYYNKAEILNHNSVWVLIHLAQCYKAIEDYDTAIKYYKRAAEIEPNNLGAILNQGHLYLAQGHLNEAIQYYYQADFKSGGIARTLRPIAWCEFLRGDYIKSEKYYSLIPETDRNSEDYLNMGHLNIVQSNYADAEKFYLKSVKMLDGNINEFISNFEEDENTLIDKNLNKSELNMILDRVCFLYSNKNK